MRACVYVHMHKRIFVCAVLVRVCVSIYARKCVLAHTLLIFIILVCVLIFFLFSIFRACCNHCFVLWRHSQFHLTVFSSVFLSCAVQFVQ